MIVWFELSRSTSAIPSSNVARTTTRNRPVRVPVTASKSSGPGSVACSCHTANATNNAVSWSSRDGKIAAVSSKGVVTGVKKGSATITARSGNATATYFVAVKPSAAAVQFQSDAPLEYNLDDPLSPTTAQFGAVVMPDDASQGIVWTSSNPAVATVKRATGEVRIVGGGKAYITATATDGSKKYSLRLLTVGRRTQALGLTGPEELAVGAGAALGVARTPEPVSNPALQWTSSDPKTASVSSGGVVKGLRAGEVTITATAKDGSLATASITIDIRPAVKSVRIALPEHADAIIDLNGEAELQLSAAASPVNASQRFVWTSSNNGIVTVDQNGLVTPVAGATGPAKITAAATDGSKKYASITVKVQRNVKTIDVAGSENVLHLGAGRTAQLTAAVGPESATNRGISWSSMNKRVATVSSKGVVKGVRAGRTKIVATAADGSKVAGEIEVQVHSAAKSVALKLDGIPVAGGATLYLYGAGKSLTLSAAVSPATAYGAVAWTSGDESVATVSDGVVTSVGNGAARITATARDGSGRSACATIRVGPAAESVGVTGPHAVTLGKTIALSASVLPAGAANRAISWSSSDPAVASVGSSGVVTGKRAGRAVVTAAAVGTDAAEPVERAYIVDVLDKGTRVQKVDITCAGEAITGQVQVVNLKWTTRTVQLCAQALPIEANQAVTWKTSDKKVATVDQNGVVTGVKAGFAKITATARDGSGRSAFVTVRIVSETVTIGVEGDFTELACGYSIALRATVQPFNRAATGVDWACSDGVLATVSADGVVTANAEGRTGSVVITAASSDAPGASAAYPLTICSASPMAFSCEEVLLDINSGQRSAQFTLAAGPATACTGIEWTIGDESVSAVDAR